MVRRSPAFFLCAVLLVGTAPGIGNAALGHGGYVPGQMICVLEPGVSIDEVNDWYETATIDRVGNIFLLEVPKGRDEIKVARRMRSWYGVASAGVNTLLSSPNARRQLGNRNSPLSFPFDRATNVTFDPTTYDEQPFVETLQVPQAVAMAGGDGTVVAVIDTGVDVMHPALKDHILRDGDSVVGYDFLDNDSDPSEGGTEPDPASKDPNDPNAAFGHGTFIAGLVARVAPRARIMPIRAFGPDGVGTLFGVIKAVAFARAHKANVVNMSFGAPERLYGLEELVSEMNRSVVFVAAMGNEGRDERMYPAAQPSVVAVAAVDVKDVRADFSNYGKRVDLAAPGVTLVSAYPGRRYATWSGTSFAAPIVSATAALVLSHGDGKKRAGAVAMRLKETAVPITVADGRLLGSGRIDPVAALATPGE
jgi:subtilisin family serine protease